MDEAAWRGCTDPQQQLRFLDGKASNRKLRMFMNACCRSFEHLLVGERSRRFLEASEQFVEGAVSAEELGDAALAARECSSEEFSHQVGGILEYAAELVLQPAFDGPWSCLLLAIRAAHLVARAAVFGVGAPEEYSAETRALVDKSRIAELAAQCDLIREIMGNPFQIASVDPIWLEWNSAAVQKLAQSIYEERDFDPLPVLADALEEAGCTDPAILAHCRKPGEHVRGCWVVDLLLGKS
jgi:hypothetical protein